MKLDKINTSEAFRYLGYGSAVPDDNILAVADECEKKLLMAIDAKYIYKYFEIDKHSESEVTLVGTSLLLCGSSISEHLAGCHGVVLLAATLSGGVDRLSLIHI